MEGFLTGYPIVRNLIVVTFFSYLFFQRDKFLAPQTKAHFWLCLVIMLSALFNDGLGQSLASIVQFLPAGLLPFIVVSGLLTTRKRQEVVMVVCIIAALCMVHNGYTQFNSPDDIGWSGTKTVEGKRITYMGIFGDPNDLGMFLVMSLPFAFYFGTFGGKLTKLCALFVIGALLYGVYLTNSRGAMLGVMSLCGLYIYFRYGFTKTLSLGAIAAPVALFVMSKFRTIEQGESANGRIAAWYEGFQMLKMNPIFGVGQGNFTEYNYHTAHNSFILVMAELGLSGYFAWSCILGLSLFMLFKTVKHFDLYEHQKSFSSDFIREVAINKTLLFSMLGFMATGFFLSRSYTILFFVFCGMATACYYRAIKLEPELCVSSFTPVVITIGKYCLMSIIFLFTVTKLLL